MPKTIEVPRDQWIGFLDEFSRAHRGWRARLEVFGTDFGAQEETDHLPLMGVSADFKDKGRERITITLGSATDNHVSHSVEHPTRVQFEQTDDGADQALQIESGDGLATLLRFLSPARPEAVDGIVPD